MTKVSAEARICAVCGKRSVHRVVTSDYVFGPSDLDGRQAGLRRFPLNADVQRCPSCGYCAQDLSKHSPWASEMIQSESYRQQLGTPRFPSGANARLARSLIEERAGDYAGAGWSALYAAWVCDDESADTAARECRTRAVTLFQRAKENGQTFAEEPELEKAIMVDLLRRSGEFKAALDICEEALKQSMGVIRDVLRFQRKLMTKADAACHSVREATGEAGRSDGPRRRKASLTAKSTGRPPAHAVRLPLPGVDYPALPRGRRLRKRERIAQELTPDPLDEVLGRMRPKLKDETLSQWLTGLSVEELTGLMQSLARFGTSEVVSELHWTVAREQAAQEQFQQAAMQLRQKDPDLQDDLTQSLVVSLCMHPGPLFVRDIPQMLGLMDESAYYELLYELLPPTSEDWQVELLTIARELYTCLPRLAQRCPELEKWVKESLVEAVYRYRKKLEPVALDVWSAGEGGRLVDADREDSATSNAANSHPDSNRQLPRRRTKQNRPASERAQILRSELKRIRQRLAKRPEELSVDELMDLVKSRSPLPAEDIRLSLSYLISTNLSARSALRRVLMQLERENPELERAFTEGLMMGSFMSLFPWHTRELVEILGLLVEPSAYPQARLESCLDRLPKEFRDLWDLGESLSHWNYRDEFERRLLVTGELRPIEQRWRRVVASELFESLLLIAQRYPEFEKWLRKGLVEAVYRHPESWD